MFRLPSSLSAMERRYDRNTGGQHLDAGLTHRFGARLRFHEWLSRWRQFHLDDRRHRRADAETSGCLRCLLQLCGDLGFHLKVAATIGKGTVDPHFVDHYVIFGALCGALAWNIITWYYGIPSSSSHALIGGLVGATVANAGSIAPIIWSGFGKVLLFIIISPLVGFVIGGLLMVATAWAFRNSTPYQAGRWFSKAQLFAAAAYSLGMAATIRKNHRYYLVAADLFRRRHQRRQYAAELGNLFVLFRRSPGHLRRRLAHR